MKKLIFTFLFSLSFYLTLYAQDLPIRITDLTENHFKVTNTGSKSLVLYIGGDNHEETFKLSANGFKIFLKSKYKVGSILQITNVNHDPLKIWDYLKSKSDYSYSYSWKMGSTLFSTDIYVYEGDIVKIKASGRIKFGVWAGSAGPEGLPSGFTMYNRVRGAKHGALLCRIGSEGEWYIVGRDLSFTAEKSGYLKLIVNDADISNNSGEFEGTIDISSKHKRSN